MYLCLVVGIEVSIEGVAYSGFFPYSTCDTDYQSPLRVPFTCYVETVLCFYEYLCGEDDWYNPCVPRNLTYRLGVLR
ncbi:hypothetical protein LCGC14_3058530 [marine sediment metagenome]|uniref:Uncharacterized protein n=1 Tax=marine sediment metagenome TaxID=412755 RepID=A0A0F8ZAD0_9ZZZZ